MSHPDEDRVGIQNQSYDNTSPPQHAHIVLLENPLVVYSILHYISLTDTHRLIELFPSQPLDVDRMIVWMIRIRLASL